MDCKKDVQLKFRKNLEIEATYDFDWLKIKIEMNVSIKDLDTVTAKQLQEMPIKSAIRQLQDLLAEDVPVTP